MLKQKTLNLLVICLLMTFIVPVSSFAEPWGTVLGEYRGVIAYSNGSANYTGPYAEYGYQYQCVEYINRFYVLALGHKNMKGGGNANNYYGSAESKNLEAYPNGGSVPPRPGDILCSNSGTYGHVAIVREVTADKVYYIQQNWFQDSRDANASMNMTVSNGTYNLAGFSSTYTVVGWLHKPGADHTPTPTPTNPPGVYLIDNLSPSFTKEGMTTTSFEDITPEASWGNHFYHCKNEESVDVWWGKWGIVLPAGVYEVQVNIPSRNATTTSALYQIQHNGQRDSVTIDQSKYYHNDWPSLGTYYFSGQGEEYVYLGDATGEAPQSVEIAFDAVRFTLQATATYTPTPSYTVTETPTEIATNTNTPLVPYTLGDTNCDNDITPADALLTFQLYLKVHSLSGDEACDVLTAADYNQDGIISPGDALCIFQKYIGLDCN